MPSAAESEPKSLKAEHAEATRAALVSSARALFAERGYAAVSIEEIVRRARVTRGALYHHFEDKNDLFAAVFEGVQRDIAERLMKAASARSHAEHLEAGCHAFLDACVEPDVQRVLLLDGPAVLGWEAWHESDVNFGLEMLQRSIEAAMNGGVVERQPVEPLSHLLLGALNGCGLEIARSSDPARARREMGKATDRVLAGLRPPAEGGHRRPARG
jgi:AcrR family transcriptional regulator